MITKTYTVTGNYFPVRWDDIDRWILLNVGPDNCHWELNHGDWGFHPDPVGWPSRRQFEFLKASDAVLFMLAWPSDRAQ